MTVEIVVVCEARADHELTTTLVDRVLAENGCRPEASCRWRGFAADRNVSFTTWTDIKKLVAKRGGRVLGYPKGVPPGADAAAVRKVVLLAEGEVRDHKIRIDGLLLVRDLDSQPERRQALESARVALGERLEVVVAAPDPKREAWVLHGFEPEDDREKSRLEKETRDLGFDPRYEAERLRGTKSEARDAKRVLASLTDQRPDREKACFEAADLATLRQRGQESGLVDFLNQVEQRLLPLCSR